MRVGDFTRQNRLNKPWNARMATAAGGGALIQINGFEYKRMDKE
jgi:hypothetical protein